MLGLLIPVKSEDKSHVASNNYWSVTSVQYMVVKFISGRPCATIWGWHACNTSIYGMQKELCHL